MTLGAPQRVGEHPANGAVAPTSKACVANPRDKGFAAPSHVHADRAHEEAETVADPERREDDQNTTEEHETQAVARSRVSFRSKPTQRFSARSSALAACLGRSYSRCSAAREHRCSRAGR